MNLCELGKVSKDRIYIFPSVYENLIRAMDEGYDHLIRIGFYTKMNYAESIFAEGI